MRRAVRRASCALVFAIGLQGCGTVESLTSSPPAQPPIEAGKGRIVFYRTNFVLESRVPDIVLNGVKLGKPLQRGMFYRDVPPGSYGVTTTIASDIVNFRVNAGSTTYVKLNPGWGLRIAPVLVEPAVGEAESSGMNVIQPSPK